MRCQIAVLPALMAVGAASVSAVQDQAIAAIDLGSPQVTLSDQFSAVRGIRELPSGVLLVADWIEESVSLVDLDAGFSVERVTPGAGPGEVRLPTGVVAMGGDSTLLLNTGNRRLSVLGPDGRVARTIPADRPGMLDVGGVLPNGHLVFPVPGWAALNDPLPDDSVRLVVMDPVTGDQRRIATLQGERRRRDQSPSRSLRLPTVGFAARDGWTVSPDGDLVIVRGGDYRLERWRVGGDQTTGPSYAYAARRVTAEDRRDFVRRFLDRSVMSGRGVDGGLGRAPTFSSEEIERLVDTTEFAETHPLFSPGDVLPAPDGSTWVGLGRDGDTVSYDVFDEEGVRTGRVRLSGERVVAHIGLRGVYVIRTGEMGLQSIERYALPRS